MPYITQRAWDFVRDDPDWRALKITPASGKSVFDSCVELAAQAKLLIKDSGFAVVFDLPDNGGTLGKDVLATASVEYTPPKANRWEVFHKDTVHDFAEVYEDKDNQAIWGVIPARPIISRAPAATIDPEADEPTDGEETTTTNPDAPEPVEDIGKPAKQAIMFGQAYEQATRDIVDLSLIHI